MKKNILAISFFLISFVSFSAGILVQRQHLLTPLRRTLKGQAFSPALPGQTIVDFNFKKDRALIPAFPLNTLPWTEIVKNKMLYQAKIKELLRFSRFPQDWTASSKILGRTDLGKVFREKIVIETEPGLKVPFYLFIPKASGPHPLILVLHGHSAGKIETAGLAPATANANAKNLAEEGFVIAAPDFRGFGELGWPGTWDDPEGYLISRSIHIRDVLDNLRAERTVLGSYLYDLEKILEDLKKRPEIDFSRIGVAGTSMGGDVAIWLGILEDRIQVIVSSHPPLLGLPRLPKDYGSYHPCTSTIPGIKKFFRVSEIPFLIAAKPLLLDFNVEHPGNLQTAGHLESLYREAGSPEKISIETHHGGEAFYEKKSIQWFKQWL